MIDLSKFDIFKNHLASIKETSADNSNGEYMTSSDKMVVNFDDVKKEYIKGLKLSKVPDSVDALFADKSGNLNFVEFKNGVINPKTKFGLQKKMYDSTLIFSDITNSHISDMRSCVKFMLVYNKEKNDMGTGKEKEGKNYIQSSDSLRQISRTLAGFAQESHIQFGLEMFKNYCCKEILTLTKEEFEEQLSTLC